MEEFYEDISLRLYSDKPLKRNLLHVYLRKNKYTSCDDFYFLERTDKVEDWQVGSLVDIKIMFEGKEIYETKEDIAEGLSTYWDELVIGYSLAYIPREQIDKFIHEVSKLIFYFGLRLRFNSVDTELNDLKKKMNSAADYLSREHSPPGCEGLSMLISLEHIKKRGHP